MGFSCIRKALIATLLAALAGCGGGSPADTSSNSNNLVLLGEQLFKDTNLSEPAGQACVSCHAASRAHTAPDDAANQLGVPPGAVNGRFGFRNAPSLQYIGFNPVFSLSTGDPIGGFDRDGRAFTLSAQAEGPLLNANEMNNSSRSAVVEKIKRASYADLFKQVWGSDVFSNPDRAFEKILASIAAYQQQDPDFAPFDSKFDQWRAGKVMLSSRELQGLALFNDPNKGNCAACHPSSSADGKTPPLFTDYSYDVLGAPRNMAIPANADASFYDLGLCGPLRTDLTASKYCGAFKVPSLRNIAMTAPYFHNGVFKTLRDVVKFYVTRDTNPELWYPNGQKFNDLPAQYQGNVNVTEGPYNRQPGDAPALNDAEIDLVVEFLQTLTDGYKPGN